MSVRLLAVQTLTPLFNNTGSLKYSLAKNILKCPENERPLLQQICYGSMRYYTQLEHILDTLIPKPIRNKDSDIYALIIIGLYQLYKLNTPEHAAISETVDVCKALKKPWATALVNATLRNFQRDHETICEHLAFNDSFKFNHPDWFIQKLQHNWPEQWQSILEENDNHPPLTIRLNLEKVSRETFIQTLEAEGIKAHPTVHSRFGLIFEKPTDVTVLPGFAEGAFSVQDEAAQLAAELTNPNPGESILDACSAPGGKLLHLLELSQSFETKIQGIELEAKRAERIEENFQRLNLKCTIHTADATEQDWWDGELFDKILLDAPCSATGVIRRNPDIKLLRTAEDIHKVAKLQREILANMWSMLKVGGRIIYATCSVFSQENNKIVGKFIKDNEDAKHVEIEAQWGLKLDYGRQLFPTSNGNDGFYYAIIEKQNKTYEKD